MIRYFRNKHTGVIVEADERWFGVYSSHRDLELIDPPEAPASSGSTDAEPAVPKPSKPKGKGKS